MSLAISDHDLLDAWTASRDGESGEWLDDLVARADPDARREDVAGWSLARRSGALLELRISRWGEELEGVVACPRCEGELELSLDLAEVAGEQRQETDLEVAVGDGCLRFRLPTRLDLDAVLSVSEPGEARRALAERCLLAAPQDLTRLTDGAVAAISERMGQADATGALDLAASCPECGHEWDEPLDVADFVAGEIASAARGLAAEVHALATAYGWSEEEILTLPAARRRMYLELVDA
ncbi:MAG TPA: hypothetical protein VFZ41_05160 [Solirubrobacterales bacterium]